MKAAVHSVIIHHSYLIQQGLKSVLNASQVPIADVLAEPPDPKTIRSWKDMLIIADAGYLNHLSPEQHYLRKNRNKILPVGELHEAVAGAWFIPDPVLLTDTAQEIQKKIMNAMSAFNVKVAGNQLTDRELAVIRLVALGDSNKQIAGKLYISIHTVIAHRKNITQKLGIKTIAGLTLYAVLNNLTD